MITLMGPGVLYGTRTDVAATPCNFGKVQEIQLDIDRQVKALYGQMQAPIDFGAGSMKITGKAKMASVSPLALANLFWGVTPGTGETLTQFLEAGAVPAVTPFTHVVANPTGFVGPYEILYVSTGLPFQVVAPGAEAAGKCSVNAGTGTLTFAAADEGAAFLVSYGYTAATGFNLTVNNLLQGSVPSFSAVMYNQKNGKACTITLPFCVPSKLNRASKLDAWLNPEIDIEVGANAAGVIMVENYPELS